MNKEDYQTDTNIYNDEGEPATLGEHIVILGTCLVLFALVVGCAVWATL